MYRKDEGNGVDTRTVKVTDIVVPIKRRLHGILYLKFKFFDQNIVFLPRDEVISLGISL